MKFLRSVAIVAALLALSESGNRPQAGDDTGPAGKAAVWKAASGSPPNVSERELRKQIQKAWRKREERVRTLLLVYVMSHKDGPERARWRRDMAERIKKNAAAPAKEADGDPRQRQIVKLAEPYSLQLLALRGNRLRSEMWERSSEREVRALLPVLTPGKDCGIAYIEDRDHIYALRPNSPDSLGHNFRHVDIQPHMEHFATMPHGLFLLLNYRSSRVPADWFPFESARLNTMLPKGGKLNTVPPMSRVVVSFPHRDLWLDPSRDYLITEIVSWRQDRSQEVVRTVCNYEKAPAPLDWVPKKITVNWLSGTRLAGCVDECVTVDWATGDDKVPKELFEFDYSDGTTITEWAEDNGTEDNGQSTKHSIVWKGKLVPVSNYRPWSESLERIKKGQPAMPERKR
jgi:hypothetical protein